ncbi:hypothetical protein NWFMUON74_39100 [Nocardia wallacei]|uniref:Uncharacterized protein n=1 Tax=Nocardia wallacei TaxID=480035 RepID=A0A7G1KLV8_9NOCA|nr:hypothetical protein NWFMUON74_39100 [Nocardia wallacei]
MTGPSPVDRGRSGSKIHVLAERAGIPLSVGISAANTNYLGSLTLAATLTCYKKRAKSAT